MIKRFAIFEGHVSSEQFDNFKKEVLENVLPKWRQMPKAIEVNLNFLSHSDTGAPHYPMILCITYPDLEAVEEAVVSAQRDAATAALRPVLDRYFDARHHHHVMESHTFSTTPE